MGSTIIEQDFPHDIIHRGQRDAIRHNKRINDAVKKQLKDVISQQDIITSEGNKKVKIRLKYLDQYRFRHNPDRSDEIGRDEFDDLADHEIIYEPEDGSGGIPRNASDAAGEELYETEYTIEELTDMMMSELELPDLDDTKKTEITSDVLEYTDRRKRVGIAGCLDKKQTILAYIKRKAQMKLTGKTLVISQDDMRYKTWETATEKHSNAVVFLMMDRSGCHSGESLIETSRGWKQIQDIKKGNRVASLDTLTGKKSFCKVSNTFKYSNKITRIIETEDTVLESTPGHVYFVLDKNGITEKTVSDLVPGDRLIYNMQSLYRKNLSSSSKEIDKYYFYGFALGDGHICDTRFNRRKVSRQKCKRQGSAYIAITDGNTARLKTLQQISLKSFNKLSCIKKYERQYLQVNNCDIVDCVSRLNRFSRLRSPHRRFTEKVLNLRLVHLAAYISGLFDAEGSVSDHAVQMTMSSFDLVHDLKIALSRFGIRARLSKKWQPERKIGKNTIRAGLYYHLQINSKDCIIFNELIGFRCKTKQSKLDHLINKQLGMKNAMRSKYITFEDFSNVSSSYGREKAGFYQSGSSNCLSHSVLTKLLNHKDTADEHRLKIKSVLKNAVVTSKIKSIKNGSKKDVYDLEVEKNHNYFVNGMLSHNSMWESKIYAVKALYFWIVQFLRRRYDKVEIKFIAHDYFAKELSEKDFFKIADSGGTRVSSAYELCRDMIKHNYPSSIWNIYCFHASDGDSWSDELYCVELVGDILGLGANLFAYAEIDLDDYREGNSELYTLLKRASKEKHRRLMVSVIEKVEDVMDTLQKFLKHSEVSRG